MIYRREIDGLRSLAVLPVVFFHSGFELFSGGFVGVDIFFVISGYLITTAILEEKQAGNFSLLKFYERRARRILPALLFMIVAVIPFAWAWLIPSDMAEFSKSVAYVALSTSNILFYKNSGYFDAPAELIPLLHTWSLAVEEQYYLIFPALIAVIWKIGARRLLGITLYTVAFASLAYSQYQITNNPSAAFYLLPSRAWELMVGALVSYHLFSKGKPGIFEGAWQAQVISLLGLVLIAIPVFTYDSATPFPGLYALPPSLGAACIILCATPKTHVGKLLCCKPFVGIGLISYSLYLWHQPLFAFSRLSQPTSPSRTLLSILVLAATFLGYLSWRYIESPFREKDKFGKRFVFISSFIGLLALVFFGVAGRINGFESRMPQEFSKSSPHIKVAHQPPGCFFEPGKFTLPNQDCNIGNKDKVIGALLGDSHARSLAYTLDQSLRVSDAGILHMSYSACPPVLDVYRADTDGDNRCDEFNTQIHSYLKESDHHSFIIMAARWTQHLERTRFDNHEGGVENGRTSFVDIVDHGKRLHSSEALRPYLVAAKYQEAIKSYLDMGKIVILVYPIPEAGWDVPHFLERRILLSQTNSTQDGSTSLKVFLSRNFRTHQALDNIGEHPNLIRIRPEKFFCDTYIKDRCITNISGQPLYIDDDHLSELGAKIISNEIVKQIKLRTNTQISSIN